MRLISLTPPCDQSQELLGESIAEVCEGVRTCVWGWVGWCARVRARARARACVCERERERDTHRGRPILCIVGSRRMLALATAKDESTAFLARSLLWVTPLFRPL